MALQAIMAGATGGTSLLVANPLLTKGLTMGAQKLLTPAMTSLGARMGTQAMTDTPQGLPEGLMLSSSQEGAKDFNVQMKAARDAHILANTMQGAKYGYLLNPGGAIQGSLEGTAAPGADAVAQEAATASVEDKIQSNLADKIVDKTSGDFDITDLIQTIDQKDDLVNLPSGARDRIISNVGSGKIDASQIGSYADNFDTNYGKLLWDMVMRRNK